MKVHLPDTTPKELFNIPIYYCLSFIDLDEGDLYYHTVGWHWVMRAYYNLAKWWGKWRHLPSKKVQEAIRRGAQAAREEAQGETMVGKIEIGGLSEEQVRDAFKRVAQRIQEVVAKQAERAKKVEQGQYADRPRGSRIVTGECRVEETKDEQPKQAEKPATEQGPVETA